MMMDAKEIERLKKLKALFDSPNKGEADNAKAAAATLLKKHGKVLADMDQVLAGQVAQPEGIKIPSFGEFLRQKDPAAYERWCGEQIDKQKKDIKDRAEVIVRYGSVEAVLAPCEREKLLRKAVRKWSKFWPPPAERWTRSIDGCQSAYKFANDDKDVPKRVLDAISQAYPLPDNIEDAIAEYAY